MGEKSWSTREKRKEGRKKKKLKTGPGSHICLSSHDQGIILEEGGIIEKYSRKTKTVFAIVKKYITLRD